MAAQRSIVVRTADPLADDDDLVVVNACRGPLGALRSGDVAPDAIQVRRADLAVEWRRVATTEGAVLTDAQIREAVSTALRLERERGSGVEVEMTLDGRALRVVSVAFVAGGPGRGERTGTE